MMRSLGILLLVMSTAATAESETVGCADGLMVSMRDEFGIPGMAVAVRRGDTLVYNRGLGSAHVEMAVPVTPATVFQLSSSAKLFAGLLAMRLVEQGRLELEAPVTRYLEDAPQSWRSVTVRHLVSMTARLDDAPASEYCPKTGCSDLELLDAIARREPAALLEDIYDANPDPSPGTGWRYGGADFLVLQQVLEKVTGLAYEEAVREQIFEPAGMVSASYWQRDEQVLTGAATDYYPDGEGGLVQRDFVFPRVLFAAGGAAASAEDLLRLDAALRAGRLLSDQSIDAMWTWQPLENGNVVSYGLGWDVKDHAPEQYSAGHSGGYLTTFRRYETGDMTVIMLANGFTIDYEYMAPDNIATALAAVWEPAIVGFDEPACDFESIKGATF